MRKHFFFGNAAKGISFSSCLAGKMGRKNVMTPIGHISEYATLGKRSDFQTSRLPDAETFSTSNVKRSKHPDWKQKTVYLPPALAQWLKIFAAQTGMESSEIVAQALREYKEKHS